MGICTTLVERQARAVAPALVLTSSSLAERVRFDSSDNVTVRDYDADIVIWKEQADCSALHEFADALYRLSELAGKESGLTYHNLPVLKLLEPRWLDPLFSSILVYANMFSSVLDKTRPPSVRVLGGFSEIERLAADIASAKAIPVSGARFRWWLRALSELMCEGVVDQVESYRAMVRRDLRELPGKANMSAYDRLARPPVLFVANINRTLERLRAALPTIQGRAEFEPCVLASSRVTLVEALKAQGLPCSYTRDWLSANEGRQLVEQAGNRALTGWRYLQSQATALLPHSWQGVRIYSYAEPLLQAACLEGSCRAVIVAEIAKRVIDRCKPVLVVNFEDGELNRAVTLLCQQRGIPTLAYHNLSPGSYVGLVRYTQEWVAVAGPWLYRSYSTKQRYTPDRIRIVGDTLTDSVATASRGKARETICRTLNLSAMHPILVLLSAYPACPITVTDIWLGFKRMFRAARQIQGSQVVVKAHPLQSVETVKQWMSAWDCSGVLVHDCDLLELCLAADLVCTISTTTAVWQPMLARTPVVYVQPRDALGQLDQVGFDYLKGKGVVHISPEEDPAPAFERLIFDSSTRQAQIERGLAHASEHVGPLDGESSSRLVRWMNEIIGSCSRTERTA